MLSSDTNTPLSLSDSTPEIPIVMGALYPLCCHRRERMEEGKGNKVAGWPSLANKHNSLLESQHHYQESTRPHSVWKTFDLSLNLK